MKDKKADRLLHAYFERMIEAQPEVQLPDMKKTYYRQGESYRDLILKFAFAAGITLLSICISPDLMERSVLSNECAMWIQRAQSEGFIEWHLDSFLDYISLKNLSKEDVK